MKSNKSLSLLKTTIQKIESYPSEMIFEDTPFSYKVEQMVNALSTMKERTLMELSDVFVLNECLLIVNIFSDYIHNTSTVSNKLVLMSNIEESIKFKCVDLKWDVDGNVLLDKISKLTEFQSYVIIMSALQFWEDSNKKEVNMKDHVSEIFKLRVEKAKGEVSEVEIQIEE